jgi:lipopolysaccharide export LptBFGC system permease protein LptF
MKLIEGYIFKNLVKTFLLTSLLFFFISTLTRVFHYLNILTQHSASIYDFLSILILIQVKIFVVLAPFSLLISSILVYSKIISSNEHIACYNTGLSKIILAKPLLYLCFIIFFINAFASSVLVPFAYSKMDAIRNKLATQITSSFLKPKELINHKGLSIFINEVNEETISKGIVLIDEREPLKKSVIISDKGTIGFDGARLSFNGESAYINQKTDFSIFPLISTFEKYKIVMNFTNSNDANIKQSSVLSNKELIFQIKNGMASKNIIEEFKRRFGWPFFTILIPLSALVCLINFFGFARSKAQFSYIAISVIVVGCTIIYALLGESAFNNSIRDLFIYYVNIILIFIFLLLKLKLKRL